MIGFISKKLNVHHLHYNIIQGYMRAELKYDGINQYPNKNVDVIELP